MITGNKIITNLVQYELSQEEMDSLKAGWQPNKIKFEDSKSPLASKSFIFLLLTTLNPKKPKVR